MSDRPADAGTPALPYRTPQAEQAPLLPSPADLTLLTRVRDLLRKLDKKEMRNGHVR